MTKHKRTVSMPSPRLLRITTNETVREYKLEVWHNSLHSRTCELTRTDGGAVYHVCIHLHPTNQKCSDWVCDCPSAQYRRGQCKHILAMKAGLRMAGVKV